MADAKFFALRDRAFDLAETGRFKRWREVAAVLRAEGFFSVLIERLGGDKLSVMMLERCCMQAARRATA